jgi:hypothetical protein
MAKPKASKTHFQQVPLKIVKKIAAVDPPDDETNGVGVTIKPPATK